MSGWTLCCKLVQCVWLVARSEMKQSGVEELQASEHVTAAVPGCGCSQKHGVVATYLCLLLSCIAASSAEPGKHMLPRSPHG